MKNFVWRGSVFFTLFISCFLFISPVLAQIPAVYTNDNFWSSEHDQPVSFKQDHRGNFFGFTATGKSFEQVIIENTLGARLQRFAIDEAFFYISDKGIIIAPNDTSALSIYLGRVV